MIANYHTHTPRCHHASGSEAEFVQVAVEEGLEILGFSDHAPYLFPEDYYSTFRMYPDELAGYVESVEKVRQDFAGQIRIPLGLEVELYPAFFRQTLSFIRDAGIEYLLLGQHFVGSEIGEHYCGRPTADTDILRRYCRQVAEAMYTGLFSYVAHPDLLYFTGDRTAYRQYMRDICRAAKDCSLPLEMNLLGILARRNYPDPVFWELAAEENCTVIVGRDAHTPQQLQDKESEAAAMELIHHLGLTTVDTVELKRI